MNAKTSLFGRLRIGRILGLAVLLLLAWRLLPGETKVVVGDFRKSIEKTVQKQFNSLRKASDAFLKSASENGPLTELFGNDGDLQSRKRIASELAKMKDVLLTENCQTLLAAEISASNKLARLEKRCEGKSPEKFRKLYDEKDAAEDELERIRGMIRVELSRIDFDISGPTKGLDFFKLDTTTLIDCAIVAKAASAMVEELRPVLKNPGTSRETVERAKRYYGMYVSAVAVQTDCFRMYLEKAERGDWKNPLRRLRDQTQYEIEEIKKEGNPDEFNETLARHEKRLDDIAKAQLVLEKHQEIIRDKLAKSIDLWKKAVRTYNRIKLDSEFASVVGNMFQTFDLVSTLQMPTMEAVDGSVFDTIVVQETTHVLDASLASSHASGEE